MCWVFPSSGDRQMWLCQRRHGRGRMCGMNTQPRKETQEKAGVTEAVRAAAASEGTARAGDPAFPGLLSFEDPVKQTFLEPRPRHSENRWMTSRRPESISVLTCFLPGRGSARHRGSIIFPLPAATSGVPGRRRAKPSLARLKFRSLNKLQSHLCPQTSKPLPC